MVQCALSGAVPAEPVVTPGGHVFERRLIEEHLDRSQRCPITNEPLEKKDLIAVQDKGVNRPSAAVAAGEVATLTSALTSQFDLLLVENQQLRQQRDEARQQLTHLLYLRDGATRVLGKHLDEIELLKRKLSELESQADSERPHKQAKSDRVDLAAEYEKFVEKTAILSKALLLSRKQRVVKARQGNAFGTYGSSEPALESRLTGARCFSVILAGCEKEGGTIHPCIYGVGFDNGSISVRGWAQENPLATLVGHEGPVNSISSLFFPSNSHLSLSALGALEASSSSSSPYKSPINLVSAGQDGTVRLWRDAATTSMEDLASFVKEMPSVNGSTKYADLGSPDAKLHRLQMTCEHVFRLEQGALTSLRIHPNGTHAAACGANAGFAFLDLPEGRTLRLIKDTASACSDLAFQPDGNMIVGAGLDGTLPVWDLRAADLKVAPKSPGVTGHLTSIDFSEIGYYVVTTSSCGQGQVWDLRKTSVIQQYDLGSHLNRARFDHSGKHIAFSGKSGAVIYSAQDKKSWAQSVIWDEASEILDAQFDHLTDDYLLELTASGDLHCHHAV